jgi:ribosomal protein L29
MKNITKGKNEKELNDLLKEKRNALSEWSAEVFQGKVKNVKEGRTIRKDIARILTALNINNLNKNEK